jgi:hypothetical protein
MALFKLEADYTLFRVNMIAQNGLYHCFYIQNICITVASSGVDVSMLILHDL